MGVACPPATDMFPPIHIYQLSEGCEISIEGLWARRFHIQIYGSISYAQRLLTIFWMPAYNLLERKRKRIDCNSGSETEVSVIT
ncbi:hypothetical protein GDO81_004634 [Engystomops pustulosus]|uniref:Uncharacterized protein n=1 Tax=Engystomops pustulosus TaxID=76066 RepID=A0AAV6ZYU4_ENGPU|nr:hypothetical protein GDO81_004634 [Engystomops pustulosus]